MTLSFNYLVVQLQGDLKLLEDNLVHGEPVSAPIDYILPMHGFCGSTAQVLIRPLWHYSHLAFN